MGWARAAVILLALANLLPGLAAADWTQGGADGAQTGYVPTGGPRFNETAFRVMLPGPRPLRAAPLLLDGNVYALATSGKGLLVEVNLTTAETRTVKEFASPPLSLVADANSFYVQTEAGLESVPRTPVGSSWSLPRTSGAAPSVVRCAQPVIDGGSLFTACVENGALPDPGGGYEGTGLLAAANQLVVQRIDVSTKKIVWTYTSDPSRANDPGGSPTGSAYYAVGLAAGAETVVVVAQQDVGTAGAIQAYAYGIRRADGKRAWTRDGGEGDQSTQNITREPEWNFATPTFGEGLAFLKFDDLLFVQPATGANVWRDAVRSKDWKGSDLGSGMAYANGLLYVATRETISAYRVATRQWLWTTPRMLGASEEFHTGGLVVTDTHLYARTAVLNVPPEQTDYQTKEESILAFALNGDNPPRLVWRSSFRPPADFRHSSGQIAAFAFAADNGVLAVQGVDSSLTVIGRAGASIQPRIRLSSANPRLQDLVTIDLSDTAPTTIQQQAPSGGSFEYRALWGDQGDVDPATGAWTREPVLRHRYASAGNYEVRIDVRNGAGQTSIEIVSLCVGCPEPIVLSPLQRLFSPEEQDKTFFVMGLFITGSGTVLGFTRLHRRRHLLQRELRAIDDAYLLTNHLPLECENALAERKTHLRGLLLDNKLNEPQYAILDARIQELRASVRLNNLDEKFDFLPVRIMKRLQRMLADGNVTRAEHEEFLKALKEVPSLTKDERDQVRALVGRWFARDSVSI